MQQLTIGGTMRNGLAIGLRNALSLVGAIILWILTIWIPYLNVGTTIGLVGIVAKMGRGNVISPTDIFDKAYRKQMGEYFLVSVFVWAGVSIGSLFLLVPGITIGLAWSLAPLLVLDKGRNPMSALQESNDLTFGKKATIFWSRLLFALAVGAVGGLLAYGGLQAHEAVGGIIAGITLVVLATGNLGIQAYIYNVLVDQQEKNRENAGSASPAPAPGG